jgi:hypothetical protein
MPGIYNNDLHACGMQVISSKTQDRKGRSKYGKEICGGKAGKQKNAYENEDQVYHFCMVYAGITSA